MSLKFNYLFYISFLLGICLSVQAGEWSGYIAGESRYFPESPLSANQYDDFNLSLSAQPEYRHEWDDGYQTFTFVPFVRFDQHDSERSHFDIRELTWLKAAEDWELRVGIRKLFWGVTESQHLVDIINQTDLVDHSDSEDKLGQPMFNLALIRDWGTVDFFILPGFRERTFPGSEGRLLSGGIPIDSDQTRYESGAKEKHVDWAVRWEHSLGDWDLGLSHFSGTSREPRFLPSTDGAGRFVLTPYYEQINQTGFDLQITKEDMLWKLEMISRKVQDGRFTALTGGLEYSFVGVFETDADVGVLAEFLFDDRDDNAATPFENDIMLGMRLALNDVQGSDLLVGGIFDLDSSASFYFVEASRRLGESWKLSLDAYIYADMPRDDLAYGFRNEDFLQLELAWFF
ncbi:hypothetical protein PN36_19080 [Candidatus Thiomargarita nelsonii]|uniref:Secreted protein containing DUF1302 n=1 Tax=Candidatus Thiomargarita nelsonii TaxID=1003181 RepID=A0A4E0QP58_9GAMM|nr:hypothetical protein PN36_19080 [Candidatus Thiomargarita nelsonii]